MASLKDNVSNSGKVASSSSDGGIDFSGFSATVINKFIEVLEAALVLIITYFIIRYAKSYFTKIETAHEQQRTALNLLEKITIGFILVVGITLALKVVGIDMSILVGVGLLGLSYGLKDIIKNYIAGILIFLKAPYKIGDTVKIKNFVGKVEKMEFQSTSLKTFDHRDITIYNSDIMSQSIENYSRYPMRRMEINVKLGYGTNMERATRIFDKILGTDPAILKNPKYTIIFKKFADNSIVLQLKFWVNVPSNMLAIRSNVAWQINKSFDDANVYSPYNKGVQTTTDFSMTDERKKRIQEFQNNPIFTDTNANPTPGQLAPEMVVIDADEPSIEEDL